MNGPHGVRAIGSLIKGKWRITSVMRAGSAAAIYVASGRSANDVRFKIVHRHLATDEAVRARFAEEAELSTRLAHPAVVRVLDEDAADDGAPLHLLEPLDGETLGQRSERGGGTLSLPETYDIAELLLDIVATAHRAGILHFEISPSNLLLTEAGVLKVLDFGALDARPQSALVQKKHLSTLPMAFSAPELLLAEATDARSDIFAVGALLYHLVTGETARPHDAPAESVASVPVRVLNQAPVELPRAFVSIVDRALEFDRADRWPDVAAMQQALRWSRRALEGTWSTDRAPLKPTIAEQAKKTRERTSQAPSAEPSTGPGAPNGPTSVTMMARWSKDGTALESEAKETPQTAPPLALMNATDETLVGAPAPKDVPPPAAPQVRLSPRRASEPTLPSASLLPEDAEYDSDRRTPVPPERLVTEVGAPGEEEDVTLQTQAVRPAAGRAATTEGSTPPPPSEKESDTLIRAAPRGPGPDVSVADADEEPETNPPQPRKQDEVATATSMQSSSAEQTQPRMILRDEPPPPTVRLPERIREAQTRRTMLIAAAFAVAMGAIALALFTRESRKQVHGGDADITPAMAMSIAADSVDAQAAALEASVPAPSEDASADAAPDVVVFEEVDAAAELESRLAAERRRKRALAAAREEAGIASEATSDASAKPLPTTADAGSGTGSGSGSGSGSSSGSSSGSTSAASGEDAG